MTLDIPKKVFRKTSKFLSLILRVTWQSPSFFFFFKTSSVLQPYQKPKLCSDLCEFSWRITIGLTFRHFFYPGHFLFLEVPLYFDYLLPEHHMRIGLDSLLLWTLSATPHKQLLHLFNEQIGYICCPASFKEIKWDLCRWAKAGRKWWGRRVRCVKHN